MSAEATVLIVDDEVRVLDSLEALLAMEHRVLRAERPEAALELLAREAVALVISDQRMPGMNGTELLTRCRELAPNTVRVLLTAFTDGFSEAENVKREFYGMDRLAKQVAAPVTSATELGQRILSDVKQHASGHRQSDDMCLLCFGRTG